MKKVINKGYTFEVESWENDGDNSKTKYYTVESEAEARRIYTLCKKLFPSLGNTMDGEGADILKKYVKNNQELFADVKNPESYICDLSYELMGGSEWYEFRVIEKFSLTHSEEDVYLSVVKF